MTDAAHGVNASEVEIPDEFELWLADRHKWLQTAAAYLIEHRRPPEEKELSELAELCMSEARGQAHPKFGEVVPGALAHAAKRPVLRINGLRDVNGVNAIRAGAKLDFGNKPLTVVFGPNGSGKSGYARLLKEICGSRAREPLIPNVFEAESPAIEAIVSISLDGAESLRRWPDNDGAIRVLRDVHVFDAKTASQYVTGRNEATYEPSRMRFVSSLIRIADQLSVRFTDEKERLVSKLPAVPAEFAGTAASAWLGSLKAGVSKDSIEKYCEIDPAKKEERAAIETALREKDITGRLTAVARNRATLDQVREYLNSLKVALGDERISALISARKDALERRRAASDDAKKVFSSAPLDGVGSATWMRLWEQARLFSEQVAYRNVQFPHVGDGARCVLCQQDLTDDGVLRLKAFEEFVRGGLEAGAKAAELKLKSLADDLPRIPDEAAWALHMAVLKVNEEVAQEWRAVLMARRQSAEVADAPEKVVPFDWSSAEAAGEAVAAAIGAEEKSLKALQDEGKRKELETRLRELNALHWLSQNKQAITDELDRRTKVAEFNSAIALTNTMALTKKNTELAKVELSAGYQKRFAEELQKIGGKRLPVTPESRQQGKGRVTFGLSLVGAKKQVGADEVLSEGETRVVALAAFLADITGQNQSTPFIFDDPISSLDQDYEERVVSRLVELADTRQVIVFTHRLSLLALAENAVSKDQLNVVMLRRIGGQSGHCVDANIRQSKPRTALNILMNEVLPTLGRTLETDPLAYEERVKGVCSDFRILVERCVESILVNEVVLRFRRGIQTQGRLGALSKIEGKDCEFFDDLMTRYSIFEHSQPDELPAKAPELDELTADVKHLAAWIDDFTKRTSTKSS